MIDNFIKAILLSEFGYDEDKTFGERTLYRGGARLKLEMDRDGLLPDLIIYGVNNGFSSELTSAIRRLIKLRKKLPGNNDLWTEYSAQTAVIEKEFSDLSKKYGKFRLSPEAYDNLGIRPLLAERILKAKRQVNDFLRAGIAVYGCEQLRESFVEAKRKLERLNSALSIIPDVSSGEAVRYANRAAALLEEWLNSTVITAIENDETAEPQTFLAPLGKISEIFNEWGCTVGKSAAKKYLLSANEAGYTDVLLENSGQGENVERKKEELRAKKAENDRLIGDILLKLSSFPSNMQEDERYREVKRIFSKRENLTKRTPAGAGERYFEGRIAAEAELTEFLQSILNLLKNSEQGAVLSELRTRTTAWLRTQSNREIGDIIMSENKLKSALIQEIEKSKDDFSELQWYSTELAKGENPNNPQPVIDVQPIIDMLEQHIEHLNTTAVANNKKTVKIAKGIIKQISVLRKLSLSTDIGDAKRKIDKAFVKLSKVPDNNDNPDNKVKLPTSPAVEDDLEDNVTNIRRGKMDGVTAAAFVLNAQKRNQTFFHNLERDIENDRNNAVGNEEKKIKQLEEKIASIKNEQQELIKSATVTKDKQDKLDLLRKIDGKNKEIKDLQTEKTKLQNIVNKYQIPESYVLMKKMLEQVNRLFSRSISAHYTVRAKAMVQNNVYDLAEIYNHFTTLIVEGKNNFEMELGELTAKIDRILKKFDINKDVTISVTSEVMTDLESAPETENAAENDTVATELTQSEEEEFERLAKLYLTGAAEDTPAEDDTVKVPEDGEIKDAADVATVNTNDSNIDQLAELLLNDFDGNKN